MGEPQGAKSRWEEWKEFFREWHRWTILDEVYGFIRWTIYTSAGGALIAIWAYLKMHSSVLLFASGGVATAVLLGVRRWLQLRAARNREISAGWEPAKIQLPRGWIAIGVAIVVIAWLPTVLPYAIKAITAAPNGSLTKNSAPVAPRTPFEQGIAFSPDFAENLKWDFLRLPRPCLLKIIAPERLQLARSQLVSAAINSQVQLLNRPSEFILPVCQVLDEEKDRNPLLYGPHNFPTSGIKIHTSAANIESREFLAALFRSQSIPVQGDSNLPAGSPPSVIYLELGQDLLK